MRSPTLLICPCCVSTSQPDKNRPIVPNGTKRRHLSSRRVRLEQYIVIEHVSINELTFEFVGGVDDYYRWHG
jgi:hypothetical protein